MYGDVVINAPGWNATANPLSGLIWSGHNLNHGDSGANYFVVDMNGTGATATSGSQGGITQIPLANYGVATTTDRAVTILNIMDYSATNKHKTTLSRANAAADGVNASAGRYASNTAITSFLIGSTTAVTYAAGSTFALYGVSA